LDVNNYRKDVSIVLCGAAGQGIQTVEALLTKTLKQSGFYVFATREYMSRVRGGVNSTTIRVSSRPVRAFIDRIDILIPLSDEAIPHLKERITLQTLIIGEKRFIEVIANLECEKVDIPFEELSNNLGGKIYANIIALGVIIRLLQADNNIFRSLLSETFKKKGQETVDNNIKAAVKGFEVAEELLRSHKLKNVFEILKAPDVVDDYIIDGRQAVGLGAIAGGCNFACFYPMAPSTGIGTFLAQHALEFNMIVDQSEDEISVINKALGASYAGARAFVSTAGGGFSLMSEGVSLAGMTELPIVIVIGMRPGPATGMPTRTCQEDIELVLYAGAGFFPKVIFAPGSIEDAFTLTQRAFNITQQYHVPVFIFPRGVPGFGDGLVDADSHTHNERGEITEDPVIRKKTVQKRFKKLGLLRKISLPPEFIGNEDYKYLVISWGSNYYLIKEALEMLNRDDVGFLFFKQIYPIHKSAFDYLIKAKIKISIEQNPTGQFGKLLENETHINMNHRILKHSGYTFSVEEIHDKLKKVIEGDENIE